MIKTKEIREGSMPEKQDDRLLSAAEVAAIWNEMAQEMGYKTHYTRFSVHGRRAKGKKSFEPDMVTPVGNFYRESKARSMKLFPRVSQKMGDNQS